MQSILFKYFNKLYGMSRQHKFALMNTFQTRMDNKCIKVG